MMITNHKPSLDGELRQQSLNGINAAAYCHHRPMSSLWLDYHPPLILISYSKLCTCLFMAVSVHAWDKCSHVLHSKYPTGVHLLCETQGFCGLTVWGLKWLKIVHCAEVNSTDLKRNWLCMCLSCSEHRAPRFISVHAQHSAMCFFQV